MPEYEFFDEDGNHETVFFPMSQAPAIGELVEHEGRVLRRVASMPGVNMGFRPFASYSLPKNDPNAREFDSAGRPCFNTERSVREFMARNNDKPGAEKLGWKGD
jgi:hypothetical protein